MFMNLGIRMLERRISKIGGSMKRITLLTLAALLILSVFGAAYAQQAQQKTVTLDEGVVDVTIAEDTDIAKF
jgi:hypothetical protein